MIRHAEKSDLPEILKIYVRARKFMIENGNTVQWKNGYPSEEVLKRDMAQNHLYVYENAEKICGVFAFIPGVDPTYNYIEGEWLDSSSYAAIHRVASDGTEKGVFTKIAEYCKSQISHLRIDTHALNIPMQRAIEKNEFQKCGIIYIEDGSPRIAFEYIRESEKRG